MIYQIGLIIAGLIITGGVLIILLSLSIIGIKTERDIMAEEYRDLYKDELKQETDLNKN